MIYFAYLILIIVLRINLIAMNYDIPILVVQLIIITFEAYIAIVDYKFLVLLKNLTVDEQDYLRGKRVVNNNDHIPDNVAVKIIESPPNVYEINF